MKYPVLLILLSTISLLSSVECKALDPEEVLVLANRNAARSIGLAEFYMKMRGIPEDNILKLWVTDNEGLSRKDYDKKIAGPVRKYLKELDLSRRIRCLLIMYGLPLKIASPKISVMERQAIRDLEKRKVKVKADIKALEKGHDSSKKQLQSELAAIDKQIESMKKSNQGSSLDSEIALVREKDYPLSGWIKNPFFVGYRDSRTQERRDDVLMVSRLDGPNPEVVRRIITDSITAEKTGLKGIAYFDARWPKPKEGKLKKGKFGYDYYDYSIHMAAKSVSELSRLKVVLNEKDELFKPGESPNAALYCGWYSLARYVDAFTWQPGSVGYHIASGECITLKREGNQGWCKRMIEEGVSATVGPVSEPYVQAFPIPELFFKFLLDGFYTLAETYALSQPFWSWQMVLIGDPLYRPFKNK